MITMTYKDIAILCRTKIQFIDIEAELKANSIPYTVVGGLSFFKKREIKDIISYLKWCYNPLSSLDIGRYCTNMVSNITEKTWTGLYIDVKSVSNVVTHKLLLSKLNLVKNKLKRNKMKCLIDTAITIRDLKNPILNQALKIMLSNLDLQKILASQDLKEGKINNSSRENSLNKLIQNNGDNNLEKFLDMVSLASTEDTDEDTNKVTLSTIHAAKGREFKLVFIPSMYEGVMPHFKAITEKELIEEKNVYYVAKTRAKDYLIITRPMRAIIHGKHIFTRRSRYINSNLNIINKIGKKRLL